MLASENGHADIIKALLAVSGIDVNIQDKVIDVIWLKNKNIRMLFVECNWLLNVIYIKLFAFE